MISTAIFALIVASTPVTAVTFGTDHTPWIPIREFAAKKGLALRYDAVTGLCELGGKPVPVDQPRLFDGTILVRPADVPYSRGTKRALADLRRQEFSAWQGPLMVMHTKLSSGRVSEDTPPGSYRTGFQKAMHISSIYGSKMPFSVHLKGNYFIHGSERTQSGPGSHGCIRLPMYNNAAEWFFRWVEPGTAVKVQGRRSKTHTK